MRDCLTENPLYCAKLCYDDKKYKPKLYKGICKTTFKKHCANHKKIF